MMENIDSVPENVTFSSNKYSHHIPFQRKAFGEQDKNGGSVLLCFCTGLPKIIVPCLCGCCGGAVDSIDDYAKDGGKERFTKMHCVL